MSEPFRLRQDGLEWRTVEGQILALDTASSTFFNANRTGATLWSALQEGGTREQLAAKLVERFDVDADTAGRDVEAFLAALRAQGLLAE